MIFIENLLSVKSTTIFEDWKIPLTEKGKQQSIEAGRKIKEIVQDSTYITSI